MDRRSIVPCLSGVEQELRYGKFPAVSEEVVFVPLVESPEIEVDGGQPESGYQPHKQYY